jgi:Uma2 family endonuclease
MPLFEIVLETTKPETEWVRGRALRKVSPTYRHGLAQQIIAAALDAWAVAGAHGRVATEWRFRITPAGELTRPLVPDVAFLSFADLAADTPPADVDVPRRAPTVAFEILSPDDRPDDVDDKIRAYLAAGSSAVITVDLQREIAVVSQRGEPRLFTADRPLEVEALPGFALDLGALFARTRAGR